MKLVLDELGLMETGLEDESQEKVMLEATETLDGGRLPTKAVPVVSC